MDTHSKPEAPAGHYPGVTYYSGPNAEAVKRGLNQIGEQQKAAAAATRAEEPELYAAMDKSNEAAKRYRGALKAEHACHDSWYGRLLAPFGACQSADADANRALKGLEGAEKSVMDEVHKSNDKAASRETAPRHQSPTPH